MEDEKKTVDIFVDKRNEGNDNDDEKVEEPELVEDDDDVECLLVVVTAFDVSVECDTDDKLEKLKIL
uniref:Uncharacterized protein n=1 Tax=Syphacia muris TaxID=451379 RepID=A0A0N5B0M7_9BILA